MRLVVNGLEQEIVYDRHAVEDLLLPRLRAWISSTDDGRRHYAFLAAPPGTGKSTLGLVLHHALAPDLQCVGIDGFHHTQAELASRTMLDAAGNEVSMASRKGAPETFDVARLEGLLERSADEQVRWPTYDRTIHDVVPDAEPLTARHVLLEGNWLLLDSQPWSGLRRYADLTIFITAPEELLRERLVDRKVRGGLDREAALTFYDTSDGPNVHRALTDSQHSAVDVLLTMTPDGLLHEGNHS